MHIATITTAAPLASAQLERLRSRLSQSYGRGAHGQSGSGCRGTRRRQGSGRRRHHRRKRAHEAPRPQTATRKLTAAARHQDSGRNGPAKIGEKMAEVTISPDEIRDALKDFVKSYGRARPPPTEVGYVVDAADGIAQVEGLPGVMANELLRFERRHPRPRAQPRRARDRCRRARRVRRHRGRPGGRAAPARCSPCRSATATSAASSTRWATRSTASATSRPRAAAPSNCRHPA